MTSKRLALTIAAIFILGGLSYAGVKSYVLQGKTVGRRVDDTGNIVQISLANDKATPDTVTVMVGQGVQFNTADGLKHDMGQGEGGGPSCGG